MVMDYGLKHRHANSLLEIQTVVQTGLKMCMGREADGEEEQHHMKLTEKTEGSICCDTKTITLKKC